MAITLRVSRAILGFTLSVLDVTNAALDAPLAPIVVLAFSALQTTTSTLEPALPAPALTLLSASLALLISALDVVVASL